MSVSVLLVCYPPALVTIERITGERMKGYRSPSWELSEHSLSLLVDCGFLYDSSLVGDDVPYVVPAPGGSLVEVPIHWELDDAPFFGYTPFLGQVYGTASPEHVYRVWSAAIEGDHHHGRSFVLTVHPWIIGRPGRLRMFERLIDYIQSFSGVRFMRVVDLADMWLGRPCPR